MLPPLRHVPAVLQLVAPCVAALPHVVDLVSQCLDVSLRFTMAAAVARNSKLLLERVITRVTSDPHLSPAMVSYWFAQAMKAAIKNDDLAVVQELHGLHPEPLNVLSLKHAMKHGTLEMVQWIIEHRHDRRCCSPGVENHCRSCLSLALQWLGEQDTVRVVEWLILNGFELEVNLLSTLCSPMVRSIELTRWCYARGVIGQDLADCLLELATQAHDIDALDVVRYLVQRGFTVARERLLETIVLLSFRKDRGEMMAFVLSSRVCDPIRHFYKYAPTRPGGAKVLQWSAEFMADPANAQLVEGITSHHYSSLNLDAVKWLYEERGVAPSRRDIVHSACRDDLLQYYEWRLHVGLTDWTSADITGAARLGYLDIILWLRANSTADFTTVAMDVAAQNGHLHVVKWLHDHSPVGCTTNAMDCAAEWGHLAVVEWLHYNRTEGCTSRAVTQAASNGCLDVVKWLCQNRTEHKTTEAMVEATRSVRLGVLQWLHENQPDGCTACAIKTVIMYRGWHRGTLDGLRWLHEHPPSVPCVGSCATPGSFDYWICRSAFNTGDLQLIQFVMEHYPETERPGEVEALLVASTRRAFWFHPGINSWIEDRRRTRAA